MSSTSRLYVGRGMICGAPAPAVLSATVGPGYAVCLSRRDGSVGGMAHIGCDGMAAAEQRRDVEARLGELERLMSRLGGASERLAAEIIGGADVLRLFPRHVRAGIVAAQAEVIQRVLERRGAHVARVCVGGTETRRVQMALPGARVSVIPITTGRGRGQVPRAPRARVAQVPQATESRVVPQTGQVAALAPPDMSVDMGRLEVAAAPARLTAVLGSCVGVAMFDATTGIGGLAHVMMPRCDRHEEDPAHFADTAVPALLSALVAAGAARDRIEAKLVGGANVLGVGCGVFRIGSDNVAGARRALAREGVPVRWEDVGGRIGRKVRLHLPEFHIEVKLLDVPGARRSG